MDNITKEKLLECHIIVKNKLNSDTYDEDLANFTLESHRGFECTMENIDRRGHHICYLVAPYIDHLWYKAISEVFNIPYSTLFIDNVPDIDKYYTDVEWNDLLDVTGVYYCLTDNSREGHEFMLWITDNIVHLYSGYGQYYEPIIDEYNKPIWITQNSLLPDLVKDKQLEILRHNFSLPPDIFNELYSGIGEYTYYRYEDIPYNTKYVEETINDEDGNYIIYKVYDEHMRLKFNRLQIRKIF